MIIFHKEYAIGIKKLSDAELNRDNSPSAQTHIGLSDKVLSFLPSDKKEMNGILAFNADSCSAVECAFSKIKNERSTKIDSTTSNPVKSVVKQIRNIASDESLEWLLIWFALEDETPVFWLMNSKSSEYSKITALVDVSASMKVVTANQKGDKNTYYELAKLVRSLPKLNDFRKENVSQNVLLATSTEVRTFIHLCLDYFDAKNQLNEIIPYFSTQEQNTPIKVEKKDDFCLQNMFMFADKKEIEKRNSDRTRWYSFPYILNGRELYLYVDWYADAGNFLSLPDFIKLIHESYGDSFRYRKSGANYELWLVVDNEKFDHETSQDNVGQENNEEAEKSYNMDDVLSVIKETGLIYDTLLIKRFATSLLTKPFIILSGLAGSGKTQLAIAFAKAMVENEDEQLRVVSVGADWTNREPLLGYPNALKTGEYVHPESGALDILINANKNPDKPYFLILDEMNLSYVERYFADFLSAMESHQEIPLWKQDGNKTPKSVKLPKNVFVIGTINVDETTYMFSPKVLDRANVIEFKVSEKDMDEFLANAQPIDVDSVSGVLSSEAADFVKIASEKTEPSSIANDVLKKFFSQLKTVNAEFGYRTASEIGRFIGLAKQVAGMADDEAIDCAIVQKLLPKLHGSRKKIVPVLKELWSLCETGDKIDEKTSMEVPKGTKYSLSADKILRMYQCAIDNGFTSFAEA